MGHTGALPIIRTPDGRYAVRMPDGSDVYRNTLGAAVATYDRTSREVFIGRMRSVGLAA